MKSHFHSTADNKSDKLKPGNPSLQHAIGSYFPIDGFPRFAPNSPFHPYVRAQPGAVYSPFPMFVEGAHAFATAPLPIPGISSAARGLMSFQSFSCPFYVSSVLGVGQYLFLGSWRKNKQYFS